MAPSPLTHQKRLYALTSNSGQASPLHNHTDTLLVLDMRNGTLLLKQSLKESTDPNTDNANKNGAILFTLNINGTTRDVVVIPEAQGHYQVLDANNGTILWSTDITPGSTNRIVASSFNPYKSQIYVISNANNAQIHNGYYLTALDAKTEQYSGIRKCMETNLSTPNSIPEVESHHHRTSSTPAPPTAKSPCWK